MSKRTWIPCRIGASLDYRTDGYYAVHCYTGADRYSLYRYRQSGDLLLRGNRLMVGSLDECKEYVESLDK